MTTPAVLRTARIALAVGVLTIGCAREPNHLTLPPFDDARSILIALGRGEEGDAVYALRTAEVPATLPFSTSVADTRLSIALHPRSLDDLALEPGAVRPPVGGPTRPLPPGGRFYTTEISENGIGPWDPASAPHPPLDSIELPARCLDLVPETVRFGAAVDRTTTTTVHIASIAALDEARVLVLKDSGAASVVDKAGREQHLGVLRGPPMYHALRTAAGEILIVTGNGTLYHFDGASDPPRLPPPVEGGAPSNITAWASALAGEPPEIIAVSAPSRLWTLEGSRFSEIDVDRPLPAIYRVARIAPGLFVLAGAHSFFVVREGQVREVVLPGVASGFETYGCGGTSRQGILLGGETENGIGIGQAIFYLANLEGTEVFPLDLSAVVGYFWTPKSVLRFGAGLLITGDNGGIGYYDDGFCPGVINSPYTFERTSQLDDRHVAVAGSIQDRVDGRSHQLVWLEIAE